MKQTIDTPTTITYVYAIVTLNIKGIENNTRIRMLEDFLWTNDIDIARLQEVASHQVDSIRRYTKYINIGTEKKGHGDPHKRTLTYTQQMPSTREGNDCNTQRDMFGKHIRPLRVRQEAGERILLQY
jgi:hypothetical protein